MSEANHAAGDATRPHKPSDGPVEPLRSRPRPSDALELDAIARAFLASAGFPMLVLGTV